MTVTARTALDVAMRLKEEAVASRGIGDHLVTKLFETPVVAGGLVVEENPSS